MSVISKKALYWTPRGFSLAFAAFVSLFAMDVFGEGLGFWGTVAALFMHLLPVFALLLITAVAWRWEWVGAVLLTALGCLYVWFAGRRGLHWQSYAFIGGPLFVMAALFLAGWVKRTELRPR